MKHYLRRAAELERGARDSYMKIGEMVVMAKAVVELAEKTKGWYTRKRDYRLWIPVEDMLYMEIVTQLNEFVLKKNDQKVEEITSTPQRWVQSYSTNADVRLHMKGHDYNVSLYEPEGKGISNANRKKSMGGDKAPVKITEPLLQISSDSREAIAVMKTFLDEIRMTYYRTNTQPSLYVSSPWGDWRRTSAVPFRGLDTLFLKEGQIQRMIDDIQNFYDSKERYEALGIPYHRGYLLYGPPGTGKTSIVKALASQFKKPLYFMSLSNMDKDTDINQLFSSISALGGFLLIEDIDTSKAVRSRELDNEETIDTSLTGMLNALDGLMTPENLLVFMTTNNREVLDDAIQRPGRVDLIEEIGFMDDYQLQHLLNRTLKTQIDTTGITVEGYKISPADVVELIKINWDDVDGVLRGLRNLVRRREQELLKETKKPAQPAKKATKKAPKKKLPLERVDEDAVIE